MLDGTVRCGGGSVFANLYRLGDRWEQVPGLQNVAELVGDVENGCALHCDGRVSCWGRRSTVGGGYPESATDSVYPEQVPGLEDVTLLASSTHPGAYYARRSDGSVWAWSAAASWLVGGTAGGCHYDHLLPRPVRMRWPENPRSLADAPGAVCAIDSMGGVWCSGRGSEGQLGNGGFPPCIEEPQRIPLSGSFVQLATGWASSLVCALRDDGTVWCWAGVGASICNLGGASPARVAGIEGAIQIRVEAGYDCSVSALLDNGTVRSAGVVASEWHSEAIEIPGFDHIVYIGPQGCAVREDFSVWCGMTAHRATRFLF